MMKQKHAKHKNNINFSLNFRNNHSYNMLLGLHWGHCGFRTPINNQFLINGPNDHRSIE